MTTSRLAYEVGTSGAKVVGKVGSIDAALDIIAKTEQSSIHTVADRRRRIRSRALSSLLIL
jgi:hypothetical protein